MSRTEAERVTVLIGLDDTDTIDTRGTNQLAKMIVREVSDRWACRFILRHQLLFDSRIPYTSKNGSASIRLVQRDSLVQRDGGEGAIDALREQVRGIMRREFIPGSDPGLCVCSLSQVPPSVVEFGRRCQREPVPHRDAWQLAERTGLPLETLGGTEDGIVGTLAAVGLASTDDDGRVVQIGETDDDLTGVLTVRTIGTRDVEVIDIDTDQPVAAERTVDLVKKLRPNRHGGRTVLWVRAVTEDERETHPVGDYVALKRP